MSSLFGNNLRKYMADNAIKILMSNNTGVRQCVGGHFILVDFI